MDEELGIENLSDFTEALIDTGGIIDRVKADGEIDGADIPEAFNLLNVIPKFAVAGEAFKEFKDLKLEEVIELKAEIKAYAESKYPDDDDDAIQRKVDKGLQFALSGVEFFKEF